MQALIARLHEWLLDKPNLRSQFAHWISQVLMRNEEYSIVLPEIHDLLELNVMLADKIEEWALAYKAEGKAEGKAETEILLFQKLLTKRFGSIPAGITQKIAHASLAELESWFDLAIVAKKLSDIFEE